MIKRVVYGFMAIVILVISLFPNTALGDTVSNMNTANTILGKINTYDPKGELSELTEEAQFPTKLYMRVGRYAYYVEQLNKLVENNKDSISEEIISARDSHVSKVSEYTGTLGLTDTSPEEYMKYSIREAKEGENGVNTFLEMLKTSPNKAKEYRDNFRLIQENIRTWSDAIRFLYDEIWLDVRSEKEAEYNALVEEFNEIYSAVIEINQKLKLDLNLGFVRPEDRYKDAVTIGHNIRNSDGDLNSWYLEIFALSSLADVTPLDDYTRKLTETSKEFYQEYSKYRVPLYVGNDKDPVKTLYKKGDKNLKRSNLRDFLEYVENEQVLYIPLYREGSTSINQTEQAQDVIKQNEVDLDYVPVYLKGSKLGIFSMQPRGKTTLAGDVEAVSYSKALMNHLQFNNLIYSGKTNDFQTDLSYPLFIDIWGNIQTYSGKIIIPGVSNMTYFKDEEYFPLNAYFINNYAAETAMMAGSESTTAQGQEDNLLAKAAKGIVALTNPDPKKMAILFKPVSNPTNYEGRAWLGEYKVVNLKKKGGVRSAFKVGVGDKLNTGINTLPSIVPYITALRDGEEVKIPFLKTIDIGGGKLIGLKETELILDGRSVPFLFVNDNIPVEKWNYQYLAGKDGDTKKLNADLLVQIAESCKNNPDTNTAILKSNDSQKITYGFKVGALLEPLHKKMSEATKNYILYTPSIAEIPGVESYISVILIPVLNIGLLIALAFTLIKYVRYVKTMPLSSLVVSIAILIAVNFGITSLYPAILNTGFNGVASKTLGNGAYYLTLYNIEKDLNSRGEFVYGDEIYDEKLITDGAFIKLAELTSEEVKAYRAAQENAPYKDSSYYIPEWDTSHMYLGGDTSVFIKGTSLYIHIKDLTSGIIMSYQNGKYTPVWDTIPAYSYYTPYLSILEGVTKSVNKYTSGRLSPKTLTYSSGFQAYTGGSLAYFSNKYFIVDNESARSNEKFKTMWEYYNGGDFLNLKNVLYLEEDNENFPTENRDNVLMSRWYKTAMGRYRKTDGGISDSDYNIIEKKIFDVNRKTKALIFDMLPYMDNIGDDLLLKVIALKATVEFNKEFSLNPVQKVSTLTGQYIRDKITGVGQTDYYTEIYPKKIELESISVDEQLKLSLINIRDLLKFNVTSIYKFVENEASWLGMIMLGLVAGLLYIRSLLRISLLSIILVIILMYMVIVYTLQKDYSNKVIVSLFGIVGMSWGVYLIDNLLALVYMHFDKRGAGVLLLMLLVWLIWNVIATAIYVLTFDMIRKDIGAFGGNLMYDAISTTLRKANGIIKSGLGLVSKTRAENFDITRPDLEMKAEEYANYLNMDYDEKLINRQEAIGDMAKGVASNIEEGIRGKLPQAKTLKEMYAEHRDLGHDNMTVTSTSLLTTQGVRDYVGSYGIEIFQNPVDGKYVFQGDMGKWENLVKSNQILDERFELYKEKDGEMFFPKTRMTEQLLTRAGATYEEVGDSTIAVASTLNSNVSTMQNALKSPMYKIGGDIKSALQKVEGVLSPRDYEVGKNALYIEDKEKAERIFGSQNLSQVYKTQHKIIDYSDRVSSGYISDSLDLVNGSMVSNEFVYGNITKSAMKTLLDGGVTLTHMGSERYKFNIEDRPKVMEAINSGIRYTEGREGIIFRETSPLSKMVFWESDTVVQEETESQSEPKGDMITKQEAISLDSGIDEDLFTLDLESKDK